MFQDYEMANEYEFYLNKLWEYYKKNKNYFDTNVLKKKIIDLQLILI